jgi:membrane protease YdiL (CAAX protease family)
VAAVLAVGVVPHLANAVAALLVPPVTAAGPVPHWYLADAIQLTGATGCAAFVTVYLIRRSGEPPARFGLGPVRAWDVPLAAAVVALILTCGLCQYGLDRSAGGAGYPVVGPRGPVEGAAMVVKLAVAAFSEELVTRGYLIGRLEGLLGSSWKAVGLSAAAFACYHAYQGPAGLAVTYLIGLALGAAYLAVRRVWPLALGHALYNVLLELAAGPPAA